MMESKKVTKDIKDLVAKQSVSLLEKYEIACLIGSHTLVYSTISVDSNSTQKFST